MISESLNNNGATSTSIHKDMGDSPVLKALASHFDKWAEGHPTQTLPTIVPFTQQQTNTQVMLQTNIEIHQPVGLDNPFWKKS